MDSKKLIEIARDQNAVFVLRWIEQTVAAAETTAAEERSRPIETPVGQLIPGRFYKIWTKNRDGKERVLRHVVPRRKTWTDGSFEIVYPKTGRALGFWGSDVKRIFKIEESTEEV